MLEPATKSEMNGKVLQTHASDVHEGVLMPLKFDTGLDIVKSEAPGGKFVSERI